MTFRGRIFCEAIVVICALGADRSSADLPVSAQPIIELTLEDPTSDAAKSYLDLDTGQAFKYGESTPLDFIGSRRWIREKGIDLMCETREPANGFIAYGMVFRDTFDPIDKPRDYAIVKMQFDRVEAKPFDFITLGEKLPRTYLFRTGDGALGVLELNAAPDSHGLRLRYKLISQTRPAPMQRTQMASRVEQQRQRLQQLRTRMGDANPAIQSAKRTLEMYEEMAKIEAEENDPAVSSLKTAQLSQRYQLELLRERYPDNSPRLTGTKRVLDHLDAQIRDIEANRRKNAPATQPGAAMPATRPS
jgi:hypothetical protein